MPIIKEQSSCNISKIVKKETFFGKMLRLGLELKENIVPLRRN